MRIACFVDWFNLVYKPEIEALKIFKRTAERLGHEFHIVREEILNDMSKFDSVFIRATTDPLFTSYMVSEIAYEMGLNVIDDPESIRICSNKIAMYSRLIRNNIPLPKTVFFYGDFENLKDYAELIGYPVVVKAPYSRFSLYVEKANNLEELKKFVKRHMKRNKAVVLQEYVPTNFDWRIGVLRGEVIYACKYYVPKGGWKVRDLVNGKLIWGKDTAMKVENIPKKLKDVAIKAAKAIGNGLYGIDIKEYNGRYYVIEVNDNPTIEHKIEDKKKPRPIREDN